MNSTGTPNLSKYHYTRFALKFLILPNSFVLEQEMMRSPCAINFFCDSAHDCTLMAIFGHDTRLRKTRGVSCGHYTGRLKGVTREKYFLRKNNYEFETVLWTFSGWYCSLEYCLCTAWLKWKFHQIMLVEYWNCGSFQTFVYFIDPKEFEVFFSRVRATT